MRSFKKILKTAAIFLLAVILLSAFFIGCYLSGENYYYQDNRERAALSGNITFLTSGASYCLFGVRPDTIDARLGVRCYNLSGTLLTLRGRYELIKAELERNPRAHTVLLEVSPDTLLRDREEEGPKGDLPMLARLEGSAARWAYFKEAFSPGEWPEVYYDMVSKGMDSALRLLTGSYTTENQILRAGYYPNHNPDKPIPNNYAEIYHVQSLPETVNPENVAWLEKIVKLCQESKHRVYLFTTPQSKYYNCVYDNLDYYQNWFTDFAAKHGIPYFNFNLAKEKLELLPDESCFYDETHLNDAGGEIFSRMLADIAYHYGEGRDNSFYFFRSYEELTWASGYWD